MKKVNLFQLSNNLKTLKNNKEKPFADMALERIEKQCEGLPSGSGIDRGVTFDVERSKPDRLVFICPFHCMDANGHYCGWIEFKVIVKPAFGGFDMRITGRDRDQIKDYLYDVFNETFE